MGVDGISTGSLLLIFLIVVVLFGTKRLRDVGEDLAAAVKGFRQGMMHQKEEVFSSEEEVNTVSPSASSQAGTEVQPKSS